MKRANRHFNITASAKRCAEAFCARFPSRKTAIVLDVILVASISVLLALDVIIEVVQLLAVCLLVGRESEKRLKAAKPV
ncbi:MAG: hypothetical protein E7442_01360 [Ruminococcaceae bacterium]|nr:hypothetical protein [Oscillospiraceae bacterium]